MVSSCSSQGRVSSLLPLETRSDVALRLTKAALCIIAFLGVIAAVMVGAYYTYNHLSVHNFVLLQVATSLGAVFLNYKLACFIDSLLNPLHNEERAPSPYVEKVRELFLFLHKRNWTFLGCVLAALLVEPLSSVRAAYLMCKGLGKFSSLNPSVLSSKQRMHDPILLIHGDSSTSGIFNPMIERLAQENPDQPLFTIDLKSEDGIVSAAHHLKELLDKVKQIYALYPANVAPQIAFIGHSSGGDVLGPLCQAMQKDNKHPKALIKIGSIFKEGQWQEFRDCLPDTVLEIAGIQDVFEGYACQVPRKLVVDTGHIGLLFHESVFNKVTELQREITEKSLPLRASA